MRATWSSMIKAKRRLYRVRPVCLHRQLRPCRLRTDESQAAQLGVLAVYLKFLSAAKSGHSSIRSNGRTAKHETS